MTQHNRDDMMDPEAALPAPPAALDGGPHTLFLDFDGTLVDIAERPDAIIVPDALPGLLERLQRRFDGRVVILTGRPVHEVEGFLPGFDGPICGDHGAHLSHGGATLFEAQPPEGMARLREMARAFCTTADGLLYEDKPLGFALHFRADPALEPVARDFAQGLVDTDPKLALQPAKMAWEVLPAGVTKGAALAATLARFAWDGTAPIHVGDDFTDRAAMRMARDKGGFGVCVGAVRPEARYRVSDPAALRRILKSWTETDND